MTSIAHGGPKATTYRVRSATRAHPGWRLGFRIGLSLAVLVGTGFAIGTAVGYALVKTFTFVHLGTLP